MPELPEVQTVVNELIKNKVIGLTIKKASIFVPSLVKPYTPEEFSKKIQGQKIVALTRRAKYIVAALSNNLFLLAHLRMSGHFVVIDEKDEKGRFERARFTLSNGKALRFDDIRKFGRFFLTDDKEKVLGKLGPEPLEASFTPELLYELLQKKQKSAKIKAWLLNQENIAGLGNIYVDEALWEAKIHPARQAEELTKKEAANLKDAIQKVLKKGIANFGTSLGHTQGNFIKADGFHGSNQESLNVFHQTGKPCPRCQTKIERLVIAQRGTHICPNCQKKD